MKLALAYSALEACENLLGEGRKIKVLDSDFSAALESGEFRNLILHLDAVARAQAESRRPNDSKWRSPLAPFSEEPYPKDLVVIAQHARHGVFHASLTPNRIGIPKSKTRKNLIVSLANSTLTAAHAEFGSWVKRVQRR